MKKEHVKLTDEERATLRALLAKGSLKARTFKRATGLLELDREHSLQVVANTCQRKRRLLSRKKSNFTTRRSRRVG